MSMLVTIAISFTDNKIKNSEDTRLTARITLPVELGKALKEAGFNRAELHLLDEGILLKPFKGTNRSHTDRKLELPRSWNEA